MSSQYLRSLLKLNRPINSIGWAYFMALLCRSFPVLLALNYLIYKNFNYLGRSRTETDMKFYMNIISIPIYNCTLSKFFLLVVLMMSLSFSLSGNERDTTILLQKIETHRQISDKINDLLELCDTLNQHKNYTRLAHFAQLTVQYSNNIKDDKSKCEAYFYLAQANLYNKDYNALEENAKSGIAVSKKTNNIAREAYFYNRLGIATRKKGDFQESINNYQKAIELFISAKDSVYLATSYNNLAICYQSMEDYASAYTALNKLLLLRRELKDSSGLAKVYFTLGNNFESLNNNQKAIEHYIKAMDIYQSLGNERWHANCLFSVGLIYHNIQNYDDALNYYNQAKEIADKIEDNYLLANIYQNIANIIDEQQDYNLAIDNHKKSLSLFTAIEDDESVNVVLLNIGHTYLKAGKTDSARTYLQKAFKILQADPQSNNFTNVNIELGRLYTTTGNYKLAQSYLDDAIIFAKNSGDLSLISFAYLYMYELQLKIGNHAQSLEFYKKHITYRDSINLMEQEQAVTQIMAPFNFEKQQAEIELLNKDNLLKEAEVHKVANQKKLLFALLGFMSIIILGTYFQFRFAKNKNKIITLEKERSEVLLLNILPQETAEELKLKGSVDAKRFDQVTVLFTDFVDFTNYAESVTPEDVVKSVDYYFSEFDKIVEKHNVEKIKTIGDAYMCVGGLPKANKTNAHQVIRAAKEIMEIVKSTKASPPPGVHPFDIRIGVNTGPVVAGVVGIHKFQYDIWGDTVNVASRMESNCTPGEINISETSYEIVKNDIQCEYKGNVELKNHGKLKMFKVL